MLNEAASGTSRRGFLGRAAGAAAAVAGAGVGAGAIAKSAAAATGRTYTSGRFALDIDGVSCGSFRGLAGGNLENEVVNDLGPDHIVRKHIGNFKWSDCAIQVGSGMGGGMYDWVKSAFDRGYDSSAQRRASIIVVGSRGEEAFRRSFHDALITEVTFPKLDVSKTSAAIIEAEFRSGQVSDSKPSGLPVVAAKQKAWLCSNFRFQIDGINTTNRIAKVDSFTWKCVALPDGSLGLDVGNIVIACDVAILPDFQQWLANLQQGADDERSGALTIVGADFGGVLTLSLSNLGVYQLRPDHAPGQLPNGRFRAEMYCESLGWDVAPNKRP